MHSVLESIDAFRDDRLCSRRFIVGPEPHTAKAARKVAEVLNDATTSRRRRDLDVPDSGRCSVVSVAHCVTEPLRRLRTGDCTGTDPDVLAVVCLIDYPVGPLKARALCRACGTVYPTGVDALRAEFTDTAYVSHELPGRRRGACHLDRGGRLERTEERVVDGSRLWTLAMLAPPRYDGLHRYRLPLREPSCTRAQMDIAIGWRGREGCLRGALVETSWQTLRPFVAFRSPDGVALEVPAIGPGRLAF
jgi:hypothetical protein